MLILKILFWTCVFIVLYTYVGYGILLYSIVWLKRRWCKQDHAYTRSSSDSLPSVTLMICAYNEEEVVEEKMRNTLALDYPRESFTVMWVTDGSSDRTNELLGHYPEVKLVFSPERKGKTAALHHGMGEVKSNIVVFTDANTMLNEGAIREMVRWFDDPRVGCVSGEKRVAARHDGDTAAKGEGLYWKYESALKRWDSELYSAMGAAGELYAIRRKLYREVPSNALLDDFMMSMCLVAEGYRIAYTSDAYAMEYGSANLEEESKRKRRIAAGGLQSVWWLRQLMNPFRHPVPVCLPPCAAMVCHPVRSAGTHSPECDSGDDEGRRHLSGHLAFADIVLSRRLGRILERPAREAQQTAVYPLLFSVHEHQCVSRH